MDTSSALLSLPIMCMFAFFASKAFDLYTGESEIEKECDDYRSSNSWSDYGLRNNSSFDVCTKLRDKKLEDIRSKKFIYLMAVGIIAIIVAFYVSSGPAKVGVSGGGALLILYALISNWGNMTDASKLFVLGGGLASLLGVSYNYYKMV